MSAPQATSVTLRALQGEPLADPALRAMVVATARAMGERQGIEVIAVEAEPDAVTVTIDAPRLAALGFAAELRRVTTRWYTQKYDAETLWGESPGSGDEGDQLDDEPWTDA